MGFYKSAEDYYKEMTSTLKDANTAKPGLIYHSLKPSSYEFSYQSLMLDEVTKRVFAKTALQNGYYDDLIERCAEMGVFQKLVTYATGVVKVVGKPNCKFPSGALFSTSSGLTYVTQADVVLDGNGIGYVVITASGIGSKYNVDIDEINIIPVKYEGILSVTNEVKIDNGYDDETYEALYARYLLKVQTPATSGNKYHYEQWALEVTGVGFAKCIPAPGNVKVIIANSNKRAANQELIQETYDYIDSVRPILAGTLTIESVTEVAIDITADVEIDSSVTLGDVQTLFANSIEEYFSDKVYNTKKISIAKLGGLLVDIPGVIDCAELKMNDGTSNISLEDNEIAVLGDVSLGVMQ